VEGVLYLAHDGRGREARLPGMTVLVRTGAGPLDGDIALPGGLYQAGKGRALAENTRLSRSRNDRIRRNCIGDKAVRHVNVLDGDVPTILLKAPL
jgi:hypothetical protein